MYEIYELKLKSNIIDMTEHGWLTFTYPFNTSSHPTASITWGSSKGSIPIGMQIAGKRFD